jgi:predicted RecB family nuclease
LAIERATATETPQRGKIIYSDAYHKKTVKIVHHLAKTRKVVDAISSAWHATPPPPLILNAHCSVCDFQQRCRSLAIKHDSLSLLGGMTPKKRMKFEEKGIRTITQLSYGYRPRRKRAKRVASSYNQPIKNNHHLRALAIKKVQTHVAGSPSISFYGTPIFLDVEGIPDSHYYYLVGLRYEARGRPIEKSFWADGPEAECNMWQKCLRALKGVNDPQIVHYGAYEKRFLREMRERYKQGAVDAAFVDGIVDESVNLLAILYGKIYAERFLDDVVQLNCSTEVASSLKKRISKNKDKLFTFLNYDGVPWNNNNAEHAVKALTLLRNGMTISTPKGTEEYCTLLTVQQTLRYRGKRFLEFLQSGSNEIGC